MNNFLYLLIIACFLTSCSLNKNSKFWTSTKKIKEDSNFKKILKKNEVLEKNFNSNLKIKIDGKPNQQACQTPVYENMQIFKQVTPSLTIPEKKENVDE